MERPTIHVNAEAGTVSGGLFYEFLSVQHVKRSKHVALQYVLSHIGGDHPSMGERLVTTLQ